MGFREVWAKRGGHPGFKDISGQRFGVVTVESHAENRANGNAAWHCRCDECGLLHVFEGIRLREQAPSRCPSLKRGRVRRAS